MKAAEGNNNQKHEEKRKKLFNQIPGFWYDLYDSPYALYDIYKMTHDEVKEIKEATEKIAAVYDKTAELLRRLPDENLSELGIPKDAIPFIREKALPFEGIIRRLDFVKTAEGWKHYELNADTPTFIMECFKVNGIVAKKFGYYDANGGCEAQLRRAIQRAVYESCPHKGLPKLVCTASKNHKEDFNTAGYLAEVSGLPCELAALEDLRIKAGEGLYTSKGERIDVLYRQTYPVEFMVEAVSEKGTKVGVELLKLVRQGKLAVINPLSAFLLQSKAVQAVIWSLHEDSNPYYTEEEHSIIEKHFIPTYLTNEVFIEKSIPYVEKPVFGREGNTVRIYNEKGEPLNENPSKTYDHHLKIYQEYVELPAHEVMTPNGKEKAHLLFGSFIIEDQASAVGIRAGSKITGNESYFLAIGTKRKYTKRT